MHGLGITVLALIVLTIISAVVLAIKLSKQTEPFYDITPYELHWDTFKCLDSECVKKNSYECYKWCDHWPEFGGAENCRLRCSDYADEMMDSIKFQNYTWGRMLPRFDKVSILKDDNEMALMKN